MVNDATIPPGGVARPVEALLLEIGRDADRLTISLSLRGRGELRTVRQVEDVAVPMATIDRRCRHLVEALNAANRRGALSAELTAKLKETGQLFRDELFPTPIKEKLNTAGARHLILSLDDSLVHIPWELLHDGEAFLGRRFAVGRIVRTRRPVVSNRERSLGQPLNMLILADPAGDLAAAYEEGIYLRDRVERREDRLRVTFRSGGVTTDFLRARIRDFDLVHFAGHADYEEDQPEESGWRLGNQRFSAAQVMKMAGTGVMPALVFANACQSARSGIPDAHRDVQQRIFGMANAFILAGVKHYVGTFWEVSDESSRRFAAAFYGHLMAGRTVGGALQDARQTLIGDGGEANLIWASYVLYGDPTTAYLPSVAVGDSPAGEADTAIAGTSSATQRPVTVDATAPEEILHFASRSGPRPRRKAFWGVLAVLLVALAAWAWWSSVRTTDLRRYEQQVWSAYQAGDYGKVVDVCRRIQDRQPQRVLSYLMLGNVDFTRGELESAHDYYQNAVTSKRGSAVEKAEALIGLGRIASVSGRTDSALDYYRQAAQLAPDSEGPYLSQAVLLEQQGQLDQAEALLKKACSVSKDPHPIEALSAQIQSKAALVTDHQRLARIDRLISELSGQVRTQPPPTAANAPDGQMLTLWMTDLASVGYHLQEGRSLVLTSACMDLLMEDPRIRIVERAMLDRMLAELKLASSPLAAQPSVLSLGRLVAARLIVLGRLVYDGAFVQAGLRCVDVETGEVKAVINQDFNTATPTSEMAGRLMEALKAELEQQALLKPLV